MTPAAITRPDRRAHAFYWTVLTIAVTVSTTGNATHAILHTRTHPAVAAAVAIVLPLALLAAVHGATILLRAHTPTRGPRFLATLMTLLIATGAFWLSFTALRELALLVGIPEPQAWLWPIIIEGSMTQATTALITLTHTPRPDTTLTQDPKPPTPDGNPPHGRELKPPRAHDTKTPAALPRSVHTHATNEPAPPNWSHLAMIICARDPGHRRNPSEIATILTHHYDDGQTPTQISRHTGRSRSTISRIINQANRLQIGSVAYDPVSLKRSLDKLNRKT